MQWCQMALPCKGRVIRWFGQGVSVSANCEKSLTVLAPNQWLLTSIASASIWSMLSYWDSWLRWSYNFRYLRAEALASKAGNCTCQMFQEERMKVRVQSESTLRLCKSFSFEGFVIHAVNPDDLSEKSPNRASIDDEDFWRSHYEGFILLNALCIECMIYHWTMMVIFVQQDSRLVDVDEQFRLNWYWCRS